MNGVRKCKMNIDKKQLIRRNLDYYSELEFAKKLKEMCQDSYYPHKDKGIDIIGIDKYLNTFFYQLKARNVDSQYPDEYWFLVKEKKIFEFPKSNKSFWVFCALRSNGKFDFFIIPLKVIKKWYNIAKETYDPKRVQHHLMIKIINKKYEIRPKRVAEKINIMKYLIK